MTGAGTISVVAGKTYTMNGANPNGGGLLTIAGLGTVVVNGGAAAAANAHDSTAVNGGAILMTQATGGTPFGDQNLTINGGTVLVNTGGPGAAFSIPNLTYAGGGYLSLGAQQGNDVQFTVATTFARSGNGTLVIVPGASGSLGNTAESDAHLIGGTTILGRPVPQRPMLGLPR